MAQTIVGFALACTGMLMALSQAVKTVPVPAVFCGGVLILLCGLMVLFEATET